ncbi:MAG TPA: hypothetical protein VHS53_07165 [Mucilaginibacter sp.]|jgi:hypothetical protein|nr:hypothetical protein [Mucilaginibacter sp.]
MEAKELTPDYLNEQQLLMLRLLKNPLPEAAFIQIRQLAVKLLAKQMDETIEEWEAHNSITGKHYEELGKKRFRSHTKKS